MNHPQREEWAPFVFGEAPEQTSAELKRHLEQCAECRAEIESWRASIGRLDAWGIPPRRRGRRWSRGVKWAAAAAMILCAGFGAGRWTAGARAEQIRAELEPELRRQVVNDLSEKLRQQAESSAAATLKAANARTDELLAAMVKRLQERSAEQQQALVAALERVAAQHTADYLALKKELDTVAVNTAAGLTETEQQLVQLAGYTQPEGQH